MKRKGLIGKILGAALALSLCMAADVSAETIVEETDGHVPEIRISTTLKMAQGAVCHAENLTFRYRFEAENEGAPEIFGISAVVQYLQTPFPEIADGNKIFRAETGNVVPDLQFPQEGIYTYRVTQEKDTVPLKDEQSIAYSEEVYTLKLWVREMEDGSGTYVKKAAVVDQNGEKVDPAEGGFAFVNTYEDGLNEPQSGSLTVSNAVEGKYGDKSRTFVYEASLVDVLIAPMEIKINGEKSVLNPGETLQFFLRPGEVWVLEAPYGTRFDVTAQAEELYCNRYQTFYDENTPYAGGGGKFGQKMTARALTGNTDQANGGILHPHWLLRWTHSFDDNSIPAPTGAFVDDLPFLVLIAAALFGIGCIFLIFEQTGRFRG